VTIWESVSILTGYLQFIRVAEKAHNVLGEDVMERKEIVEIYMESPLYFTMPIRIRLEFFKKGEYFYSDNVLRKDLLNWVRTGHFNSSD